MCGGLAGCKLKLFVFDIGNTSRMCNQGVPAVVTADEKQTSLDINNISIVKAPPILTYEQL
jgi:hypothetical protein